MTIETLDLLPGEGETKTVTTVKVRRECEVCGEPAHFRHSFLLYGARNNPASSAYRKDDCSFCSDEETFTCREHTATQTKPDGYSWCSTFPANALFAHMFLTTKEMKP